MQPIQAPAHLKKLFMSAKHHHMLKGQVIQSSDDKAHITYLAAGYIKRYIISDEGAIKVQSIYAPGYVFPLTQVFKTLFETNIYEGKETIYYDGLTDVEFYTLDDKALMAAVTADPLLYRELLYETGQRFRSNIQWLENATLKSSYHRLVHRLIYLGATFGVQTNQGIQIAIPLTHQDLADISNMARETISRHMTLLSDHKLILTGKLLTITDMAALERQLHAA